MTQQKKMCLSLAILLSILTPTMAIGNWTINYPMLNVTYTETSSVTGSGNADSATTFVWQVLKANGMVENSAGGNSMTSGWMCTVNPPIATGKWVKELNKKAELIPNGVQAINVQIHVQ